MDGEWIDQQKQAQDVILSNLELVSREYTDVQKNIIRGMEVIGQVAKLYKKRGKPPVFVPIPAEINPPRSRERLAKQTVQPTLYGCGTCKLPYIGKVRCQCKPEVKARTEAA